MDECDYGANASCVRCRYSLEASWIYSIVKQIMALVDTFQLGESWTFELLWVWLKDNWCGCVLEEATVINVITVTN